MKRAGSSPFLAQTRWAVGVRWPREENYQTTKTTKREQNLFDIYLKGKKNQNQNQNNHTVLNAGQSR